MPHASPCQWFLPLCFFLWEIYYISNPGASTITVLHHTSPQSWPLAHTAPCHPEGKHLLHEEGGKGASATLQLSLPARFSLFLAVSPSLCLYLSVQQRWLDLLAPGSCYAHNILDQSSLVIGQCGSGQRENRGSCHQQRCPGPLISIDSQRN